MHSVYDKYLELGALDENMPEGTEDRQIGASREAEYIVMQKESMSEDDREMFLGSFGGWALGNEFTHWFAATHDFATAVFDHGDYVAAMSANKKFNHNGLLYFLWLI
jgi:hypothetical protein